MWGVCWAIFAATAGAVLGVLMPSKVGALCQKTFQFFFKQEQTTQLVLAIVGLILSIFIPPLIFLLMGMHGGKDLHKMANDLGSSAILEPSSALRCKI